MIECRNCDFNFYFSPASTNALILVNKNGEVLLTKRKFEPQKGYWDLPGGFVGLGETVEQSLIRETKEELDLTLKDFTYFGSYTSIYPYRGIDYQTLCPRWLCRSRGNGRTIFNTRDKGRARSDVKGFYILWQLHEHISLQGNRLPNLVPYLCRQLPRRQNNRWRRR